MRLAVLIIATNKYIDYVQPLIDSADKYLCEDKIKTYFVFTDKSKQLKTQNIIEPCYIDHYPFPYPTLFRFYFFQKYYNLIKEYEQMIYIDADALFVSDVGDEIISPRCAVQHCGFVNMRGSYETNKESKFYVSPKEGGHYFGGGFWSFDKTNFNKLMAYATDNLVIDFANRIIPVWHDESILNRWLIDNPPTNILTPSYHYPEPPNEYFVNLWAKHGLSFEPKIMMLNKNHYEIRK